jgi:hypothetical protein
VASKLDRRRVRSIVNHEEAAERRQAVDALAYSGHPSTWPPGKEGEARKWGGSTWVFHRVKSGSFWFRDVA